MRRAFFFRTICCVVALAIAAELSAHEILPELFRLNDGTSVRTSDQWKQRRVELKQIIQKHQYGHVPGRPSRLVVLSRRDFLHPTLKLRGERIRLGIGPNSNITMDIMVYPSTLSGKRPAIVREEHRIGVSLQPKIFVEAGFVYVEYEREDLDPDTPNSIGSAQAAYPQFDWATIAVWAWGAMRTVDYLETRQDIDLAKVAVSGHSRGGKAALLAGALDERFSLVNANGSGAGGAGSYIIENPKCETLELITRSDRFGYWFHPNLRQFKDDLSSLPFDQHFLKALIAPRALICTEATSDLWANPKGTKATSRAAQEAFDFLGASEKNGLHFRSGGHNNDARDWQAFLQFARWHFEGQLPTDKSLFQAWKTEKQGTP